MRDGLTDAVEILGDLVHELHHQVHVPGCKCRTAIRKLRHAMGYLQPVHWAGMKPGDCARKDAGTDVRTVACGEATITHTNGYFESVDEFLEWAEDNYAGPGHVPVYVWACEDIGIRGATLDDFTSNTLDGMWEDAELDDLNGVPELEAAIALFNEANKSISVWSPDYSKAIMLAGASEAS